MTGRVCSDPREQYIRSTFSDQVVADNTLYNAPPDILPWISQIRGSGYRGLLAADAGRFGSARVSPLQGPATDFVDYLSQTWA
jgi:hypothetical protein